MSAILASLGTAILTSLINFFKTNVGKITIGVSLFYLLLTIIPFKIELSNEIMNILTGDFVKNLLSSITFLFPVKFGLSCLLLLLFARHSSIFTGIVTRIYHIITGGGNSGS